MDGLLKQKVADRQKIAQLAEAVTDLQQTVKELTEAVGMVETVEPRKISKRDATKEIKEYFDDHRRKAFYPSDVAEALNLDYSLVEDIINALVHSGEIKFA